MSESPPRDLTSWRQTTRRRRASRTGAVGGARHRRRRVHRLAPRRPVAWPSGVSVDVVDDLSSGSLANLADARNAARLHRGRDADPHDRCRRPGARQPDLAAPPAADRAPRPAAAGPDRAGRARPLVLVDAHRPRGGSAGGESTKVVVLLPATVMYGQPASRELPIKEGPIVPRGVRGCRGEGDHRPAERVPGASRDRVHRAGGVDGVRVAGSGRAAAWWRRCSTPRRTVSRRGSRATGVRRRDFVFVDDVVDAVMRARQRGSGLVVNVGTGVQTSLRDLGVAGERRGAAADVRRRSARTSCCASACHRCGRGSTSAGRRGRRSPTAWPRLARHARPPRLA